MCTAITAVAAVCTAVSGAVVAESRADVTA